MTQSDALTISQDLGYKGNESVNFTMDVLFWKAFSQYLNKEDYMGVWKEFNDWAIEHKDNGRGWFEPLR
jgi:hypothetical protein